MRTVAGLVTEHISYAAAPSGVCVSNQFVLWLPYPEWADG